MVALRLAELRRHGDFQNRIIDCKLKGIPFDTQDMEADPDQTIYFLERIIVNGNVRYFSKFLDLRHMMYGEA